MDRQEERDPDESTAIQLEIDDATAARTEDLLRSFAEEAGVETALVTERSGALVAGISETDISTGLISALVGSVKPGLHRRRGRLFTFGF